MGVSMRTSILILALASAAAADEVALKAGGKVTGIVEERGDKVLVRTEHGVLTFTREQVARIDRSKASPLQEYQERLVKADLSKREDVEALLAWAEVRRLAEAIRELRDRLCRLRWDALDHGDPAASAAFAAWARANGCKEQAELGLRASIALQRRKAKSAAQLYGLGLWAKANGMGADALVLFQEAIVADPDHEHARREMGYLKVDGVWRTDRELKLAKGLIEFEGEWMTPQAKEGILLSRTLEKERRLLELERARIETARAEGRREYERQRADLEARALHLARQIEDLERRRTEWAALPQPTVVYVRCTIAGCTTAVAHRH